MDSDSIFQLFGVASGQSHGHGHVTLARHCKNNVVALPQSGPREGESAELVLVVGVGTGQVEDQIWLESNRFYGSIER